MGEGVLLDDVDVPSGDAAAGIHVVAKVGACQRLKGLRFAQIRVAAGHYSARVNIANKHTHLCRNRAAEITGYVADATQSDRNSLRVSDSSKLDNVAMSIITADVATGHRPGSTGHACAADTR